MTKHTKTAMFAFVGTALGAVSFFNAFADGLATQVNFSEPLTAQLTTERNGDNPTQTAPNAPALPKDYQYLKDGSVAFTGYQALGVPSTAKELPKAPPLPEGQIYLPDGTVAYLTQPDYGFEGSALSTEGRIYLADGSVAYEAPETVQAKNAAAAKASYESAMFANPALARLMEDEALQQSLSATMSDSWKDTVSWRVARYVSTERQITRQYLVEGGYSLRALEARTWFDVLTGQDAVDPNYNRQAYADELTDDIPAENWGDLMVYDNQHSAFAARARILDDQARERRLAAQRGTTATLAMGVGKLPDLFALCLMLILGFKLVRLALRRRLAA